MTDRKSLCDRLASLYRIRLFEEEVAKLRQDNLVVGSVHLCNGQEAIYAGAAAALDLTRDVVFPTYRGHGWALACGAPMEEMFAELLGRQTGLNGGRGGSAYLSAPDHGMYGENSIVGAGAPVAVGAALAGRLDGSNRVAVAAFGDGALNQGAVSEAMNFAAVRRLPVIFLVENNHYSELTPIASMVVNDRLYTRGSAFGVRGVRIDGNDVVAVEKTVTEAARRVRTDEGPVLIEAMTQRIVGHYIGDIQHYRPAGEVDQALEDEPIIRLRRTLLQDGADVAQLDQIHRESLDEVVDARERALQAPVSDPSTVLEHLYA